MDQSIPEHSCGYAIDSPLRSYPGGIIDIHDRVLEKYKHPPNRFESKFQEYIPRYHTRLPRAPALRVVSAKELGQITDRLSRSTTVKGRLARQEDRPTTTVKEGLTRQGYETSENHKHNFRIEKFKTSKMDISRSLDCNFRSRNFQSDLQNDQPQNDQPQNLQSSSPNRQTEIQKSQSDKSEYKKPKVTESQNRSPDPVCSSEDQVLRCRDAFTNGTCQNVEEDVIDGVNEASDVSDPNTISDKTNTRTAVQQETNGKGKTSQRRYSDVEIDSGNKSSEFGDMKFLKQVMYIKNSELDNTGLVFRPRSCQAAHLIVSPSHHKAVLKLPITKHKPQVYTFFKSEESLYPYKDKTDLLTLHSLKTQLPGGHNNEVTVNPGRHLTASRNNGTKRRDLFKRCRSGSGLIYQHRINTTLNQLHQHRNNKKLKHSKVGDKSSKTSQQKQHDFPRGRDYLFIDK